MSTRESRNPSTHVQYSLLIYVIARLDVLDDDHGRLEDSEVLEGTLQYDERPSNGEGRFVAVLRVVKGSHGEEKIQRSAGVERLAAEEEASL